MLPQEQGKHDHNRRKDDHGKKPCVEACGLTRKGQEFSRYVGRYTSDKGRSQ